MKGKKKSSAHSVIAEAELNLFLDHVKGVKPLQQEKIVLKKPSTPSYRLTLDETEIELKETTALATVESETFISYAASGVSRKILRKLRKGQYNVDAILDLHGMTVERAGEALKGFLQTCITDHRRVSLIIHGKARRHGLPILKNKLNLWLRELSCVLAFCSAGETQGSRGAVAVLLREEKECR